jgi:hypothetical protein
MGLGARVGKLERYVADQQQIVTKEEHTAYLAYYMQHPRVRELTRAMSEVIAAASRRAWAIRENHPDFIEDVDYPALASEALQIRQELDDLRRQHMGMPPSIQGDIDPESEARFRASCPEGAQLLDELEAVSDPTVAELVCIFEWDYLTTTRKMEPHPDPSVFILAKLCRLSELVEMFVQAEKPGRN